MFLNWSIAVTPEEGTVGQEFYRIFQSIGSADQTHEQIIDSTTFHYSRSSAPDSLPLISTLLISPLSNRFNGTMVKCADVASSNTASTKINIINKKKIHDLELNITSLSAQNDGVIVTLSWTQENTYFSYNIISIPQAAIRFIGITVIQLKVPYNILYSISIVSTSPCEQMNMTSYIELRYSSCRNPTSLIKDSNKIKILGYKDAAMEGDSIIYTCQVPGSVLTGTNTSVCMENGEWEPNPEAAECEEVKIERPCNVVRAIVVSSLSTFVATVLVVIITGYLCSCCCGRKCKKMMLVKDDVFHKQQKMEFQLEENVAYHITAP